MAGRPAGKKFPHVTTQAKPHDHRWCPVVATIARRVLDGYEQWGTRHPLPTRPAITTDAGDGALDIKRGLYRARDCAQLRAEGLPQLSIQADYDHLPDGTYQPWIRVWDRRTAKREIVRRVQAGEPLDYNVMRSKLP